MVKVIGAATVLVDRMGDAPMYGGCGELEESTA